MVVREFGGRRGRWWDAKTGREARSSRQGLLVSFLLRWEKASRAWIRVGAVMSQPRLCAASVHCYLWTRTIHEFELLPPTQTSSFCFRDRSSHSDAYAHGHCSGLRRSAVHSALVTGALPDLDQLGPCVLTTLKDGAGARVAPDGGVEANAPLSSWIIENYSLHEHECSQRSILA